MRPLVVGTLVVLTTTALTSCSNKVPPPARGLVVEATVEGKRTSIDGWSDCFEGNGHMLVQAWEGGSCPHVVDTGFVVRRLRAA